MYKRNAQGWSKHFDFMIVDEISLQIAFILAAVIRNHIWAYAVPLYRTMGITLILVDAVVLVLHNSLHDVVKRGVYAETIETFKHCFYVLAIAAIYMFATQTGDAYSRIILFVTFLLHLLFGHCTRIVWKTFIKKHGAAKEKKNSMLVVAASDTAEDILKRLSSDDLADFKITGVVLTEQTENKTIGGYPIVADMDGAADYIVREWVDSVYIDAPLTDEKVIKLMDDCSIMAVPTHYHVPNMSRNGVKRFSEKIGGTTVLTTSINYATPIQMLMKRCFDIVAGLIGSLIALIIMAIVGPIIKKQSPGPILFSQERIGQNGKRFKMYKIRSMYMDAEERKKDLMDQNRVKDGMMFKLDFDPRIIGNEILPDGTKKTGIGDFIRRTSLDEFPQFFLVLKGTLSTVGTRPPTIDEYIRYQYHHRARMATKPGITGMWQVNGRSEITDFEEVVRLDTEYITNWSIGLDLKILFKTIGVLFSHEGAM
ncbi:MAG: sugar transferase [Oscillospiraceae bacterium]|nr:sugar transferase [Oscillospiraceae bacterium]